MKLSELGKGQAAKVVSISASPQLKRRLLDMGMLIGETVVIEGVAPLGDPFELSVRNYRLSLRRHEVEGISVEEVR